MYEALAGRVAAIIKEVLDAESVNYHSISSRAKEVESFQRKASREKYKDPLVEITDMAGVRVITYIQSDAVKVANLVKKAFAVIPKHSVDKSVELGTDRVGYRSIHLVATLGKTREQLPENKIFRHACFEIQVKTILQHAWAEFEHDRNYKFAGVLPEDIRRRFYILAGNLESVDREFDTIAGQIDQYAAVVDKKTQSGDLGIPIDSTSLKTYLNNKFGQLVKKGVDPVLYDLDDMVIGELRDMGITTLERLDKVIPANFVEIESKHVEGEMMNQSFLGLLRDLMIIHDIDRYFNKAWKGHWSKMNERTFRTLKEFGINISPYAVKKGIDIM